MCATVDAEAGAAGYTPTFPKSYVVNRGTYKPPTEYMQLPSADDSSSGIGNAGADSSRVQQAVYEQCSRTHSFPRDADDEETVTF